jgi:hypothetical protein
MEILRKRPTNHASMASMKACSDRPMKLAIAS